MTLLIERLQSSIRDKHLLDHPFYQRWNEGTLTKEELCDYAQQYFHYTMAFPTFLSATHANSDDLVVRQAVLENLIEEERGAENHPELWLRFCEALGLDREEVRSSTPSEATTALIGTMKNRARSSTHEGLAALYAYESQVPAVAQAKIDGLRKFYEIESARDISFFTVHLEADVLHAKTSEDLLNQLCADAESQDAAGSSVAETLDALDGFLDSVNREPACIN